jgi:hypothetical protein
MFATLRERIGALFGKRNPESDEDYADSDFGGTFYHIGKILALVAVLAALFIGILGVIWSFEPDPFSVSETVERKLAQYGGNQRVGSASAATLIRVAETLLDKPGGYLSNDILPPGLYLDNIPNWEFGVLVQVRDFSRAFRESFSRSQSQSQEDRDLSEAEPLFSFNNNSWVFPATESEYRRAINLVESYLQRLVDPQNPDAQFYARADNLSTWLLSVESRLGSLSCRLSDCVRLDRRSGAANGGVGSGAVTTGSASRSMRPTTPWLQVDDIFYEARGTTWALLHFLRAIEIDFADVLENKNATVSLRQIIRDLEFSQRAIFPVILNGSGFGIFANHSLTMANYVSRANAAIIDLRNLLAQG